MTPALRAYLADWLHWAENGAPEYKPYSRGMGLCGNTPDLSVRDDLERVLINELGSSHTPFSAYSDEYFRRHMEGTHHLCPNRLTWVRAKLEQVPA